jgi:hypothetical protein
MHTVFTGVFNNCSFPINGPGLTKQISPTQLDVFLLSCQSRKAALAPKFRIFTMKKDILITSLKGQRNYPRTKFN